MEVSTALTEHFIKPFFQSHFSPTSVPEKTCFLINNIPHILQEMYVEQLNEISHNLKRKLLSLNDTISEEV